MMFIGCKVLKLDSKKRLTIPANYRKQFEENRLFLSKVSVMDKPVVAVFPTIEILESHLTDYLPELDINSERNLAIMTSEVQMDSAYRIAFNSFMEERDEKEMVVSGRKQLFEIWYRSDFNDYCHSQNLHLHL